MKSFLLMGQSNMAGRGVIGQVPEIENPKCFMLRNGRWQLMGEPINPDRAGSIHDGVSLAASFADEYAKYFDEEIGLIPCADGGSSIKEWQPGELLYDNAVFQAKLAQRTSRIVGILWHQGENDSYEKQDKDCYHDRFINLFTTLFKDLNLPENTPVLIGEIGDFVKEHDGGNCKYFSQINETLKGLSKELSNSCFVSSKGLTCKSDLVHFDSKSLREFGKRYFKVALITDSIRAAGYECKTSIIGSKKNGMPVIIEDDVAKLPDKSAFAGSIATMERLVRNMVNLAGATLTDAVKMATKTPASIMKMQNIGEIKQGYVADFVIFDKDINIKQTIVAGKTVYKV